MAPNLNDLPVELIAKIVKEVKQDAFDRYPVTKLRLISPRWNAIILDPKNNAVAHFRHPMARLEFGQANDSYTYRFFDENGKAVSQYPDCPATRVGMRNRKNGEEKDNEFLWNDISGLNCDPDEIAPVFTDEIPSVLEKFHIHEFKFLNIQLTDEIMEELTESMSSKPRVHTLNIVHDREHMRFDARPRAMGRFTANFVSVRNVESNLVTDEMLALFVGTSSYKNLELTTTKAYNFERSGCTSISAHYLSNFKEFDSVCNDTKVLELFQAAQMRLGAIQRGEAEKGVWIVSVDNTMKEIINFKKWLEKTHEFEDDYDYQPSTIFNILNNDMEIRINNCRIGQHRLIRGTVVTKATIEFI